MQQKNYQWLKQLAAAALLMLLVFIQLGKAIHTHTTVDALKANVKAASFQNACTVCDYHFAKDADNYTASYHLIQLEQQPSSFNIYVVEACKSLHHFSQLRGPPTCNA